jgi:uncharacterized protein YcnI
MCVAVQSRDISRGRRMKALGRLAVRTFLGVAGLSLAAVALPAPASAEVAITPTTASYGGGVNLTFKVPDDRGLAYTERVEIQLPQDNPVPEVYPLSVNDWGPQTTNRQLDQPVTGIHGGSMTTITSAITWVRVVPPSTGGQVSDLTLAMGPMPEADRLTFTVVQTYNDGLVKRWTPTLTLTPAPGATASSGAGAAGGHSGHDAGAQAAVTPGTTAAGDGDSGSGATIGYVIAALVGGLIVLLVALFRSAGRRLRGASAGASAGAPSDAPAGATGGEPAAEREREPEPARPE